MQAYRKGDEGISNHLQIVKQNALDSDTNTAGNHARKDFAYCYCHLWDRRKFCSNKYKRKKTSVDGVIWKHSVYGASGILAMCRTSDFKERSTIWFVPLVSKCHKLFCYSVALDWSNILFYSYPVCHSVPGSDLEDKLEASGTAYVTARQTLINPHKWTKSIVQQCILWGTYVKQEFTISSTFLLLICSQ